VIDTRAAAGFLSSVVGKAVSERRDVSPAGLNRTSHRFMRLPSAIGAAVQGRFV